jgi:hypothetical protein
MLTEMEGFVFKTRIVPQRRTIHKTTTAITTTKTQKEEECTCFSPYIHNEETVRAQTTDENRFQKLLCNIFLA